MQVDDRYLDEIRRRADAWRKLRTWRRDLSTTRIVVARQRGHTSLGYCDANGHVVTIYACGQFDVDLSTVLHELAHADTTGVPQNWHGSVWATRYCDAAAEVIGERIAIPRFDCATTDDIQYAILVDTVVERGIRLWWQDTGMDLAWRLGSGEIHERRATNRRWGRVPVDRTHDGSNASVARRISESVLTSQTKRFAGRFIKTADLLLTLAAEEDLFAVLAAGLGIFFAGAHWARGRRLAASLEERIVARGVVHRELYVTDERQTVNCQHYEQRQARPFFARKNAALGRRK